jgi:hypothetical protein
MTLPLCAVIVILPGEVADAAAPVLMFTLPAAPVPPLGSDPALIVTLPAVAPPPVEVVSPAVSVMEPAVETVFVFPAVIDTDPPGEDPPTPSLAVIDILPPPTLLAPTAEVIDIPFPV